MCTVVLSSFVCLFSSFSVVAMYSSVLKSYYSSFSDLEMLLTIPRYNEHFGSFTQKFVKWRCSI